MNRFQLRNPVWEQTIDLLFDGFLQFNRLRGFQAKHLVEGFKEDGGLLAMWMLKALAPVASPAVRRRHLETARMFLGLLDLHLQIAKGLGLLDRRAFQALSGKTRGLDHLISSSRAG